MDQKKVESIIYLSRISGKKPSFHKAKIHGVDFSGVDMMFIDFSYAEFTECNFSHKKTDGNFDGASFYSCKMRGFDMRRSVAYRCLFYKCDMTSFSVSKIPWGSVFQMCDIRMSHIKDSSASGSFTVIDCIVDVDYRAYPHSTFGKHTGDYIKAKKSIGMDPVSFKKKYTSESDRIKHITKGRPIRPEVVAEIASSVATRLEDGRPLVWFVTRQEYHGPQRITPLRNTVALFNIRLPDFHYHQRSILTKLAETSRRSGHPHESGDLFSIGWVRYLNLPGSILIEEVQSDVEAARRGLKDKRALDQMGFGYREADEVDRELSFFQPYVDAFYYDAVGTIFEIADVDGKPVEMLSYAQKEQFSSPKSVYEDLPRKMGMAKVQRSAVDEVSGPVWYYKPNRRRRRT